MDFCPSCGTRLTFKPKKGRKDRLSCLRCGYEKPTTPRVPKILEHPAQRQIAVIGKTEQKLRTLPTIRTECPRCGNNLAYAWMVQVRRLEESSTQFFRCTKCNYTFRENS